MQRGKRRALQLLWVWQSQNVRSGHVGVLRLEPECSENTKSLSNECVWQVGHRGLSLLLGNWFLAGVS